MSDAEKRKILESLDEALPAMSDFDKGYILGMAETAAATKREHPVEAEYAAGAAE